MDQVTVHNAVVLLVQPALGVKDVAVCTEDLGVAVVDPGVDAENGLDVSG